MGVDNAIDFIATLRQSGDLTQLPIGRRVVVIGGGMTAVDAAVQSKLLGAEEVTMVYRRGKEQMNASGFEQDLAASKGVTIRHWLAPKRVIVQFGKVEGIELSYMALDEAGNLKPFEPHATPRYALLRSPVRARTGGTGHDDAYSWRLVPPDSAGIAPEKEESAPVSPGLLNRPSV